MPVISIGVPTGGGCGYDRGRYDGGDGGNAGFFREGPGLWRSLGTLNRVEKQQMIRELLSPHLNTMYVTPKDIDETVKRISFTISEGINIALGGMA